MEGGGFKCQTQLGPQIRSVQPLSNSCYSSLPRRLDASFIHAGIVVGAAAAIALAGLAALLAVRRSRQRGAQEQQQQQQQQEKQGPTGEDVDLEHGSPARLRSRSASANAGSASGSQFCLAVDVLGQPVGSGDEAAAQQLLTRLCECSRAGHVQKGMAPRPALPCSAPPMHACVPCGAVLGAAAALIVPGEMVGKAEGDERPLPACAACWRAVAECPGPEWAAAVIDRTSIQFATKDGRPVKLGAGSRCPGPGWAPPLRCCLNG